VPGSAIEGASVMSRAIRTESAPQSKGHYSQVVQNRGLVFISGQLPLDRNGRVINGSVAEEAKQALLNVRAILEAAGGSVENLAQCMIYISEMSLWAEVNEVYGKFFEGVAVLPARAVVPVKELHYGARIEIQAIAVIDGPQT
jgi:2-iminobutanoate/2-iminopropanoate deaminase